MPKRDGPKPAAALAVVPMLPGMGRPDAPEDLSKLEREIWKSTVDSMPLRWFGREQQELLRGYCAHCGMARQIADRWRMLGYNDEIAAEYDRETSAIIKLARALRLTKLGRYERNKDEAAIRNAPKKRLWET